MFSFLSNAGATLCFGTNQNRHIGIHALNYDSCPDSKSCNISKSQLSFSDCQNEFNCNDFQMNLNRIVPSIFNYVVYYPIFVGFHLDFSVFEEKYNKVDWDIYKNNSITDHLKEFENIVLII